MPVATGTSSMAVEHASELVSIVASYLRKHGFAKTLSVFLRENGDAFQETDVADLETLYKLYISTQPNGASKAKKPRTTKSENGPVILEGDKDGENASASLHTNGGTSSEKKKRKKGDKKNVSVDLPVLEQTGQQVDAVEAKKTTKEGGSKKKKGGENIEGNDKGIKSECEKAFSNGNAAQSDNTVKENNVENHDVDGGFLGTQQELAYSRKSSIKTKKKEQKEQECLLLQGKETSVANEARAADNAQVLSQEDDMPKKKRKKSKDSTCKEGTEDGPVVKSASEVLISEHTENLDASKQPVNALKQSRKSVNELKGGEIGSKKKKHIKELSSQCAEGGLKEPAESELEESKKDDTDNMKHSGKKRKLKEYVDAGKKSNQDFSNLGSSPEKLKEVEGIANKDVEMHDSMSAKAKKKEETPNDKKTPTGALAFKRVEVEKVAFSDPRLSDNSYWAKDGAEEGYGAKAQEVLGLVRGRDFRHEKTKKKRGSYRGGIIGFESHSIKFENSDED